MVDFVVSENLKLRKIITEILKILNIITKSIFSTIFIVGRLETAYIWKWVTQSCLTLQPHGLYSPWNSPGQNTRVGTLSLLQGIFPAQGLNPGLPHCRRVLYQLSHKGRLICEKKPLNEPTIASLPYSATNNKKRSTKIILCNI